MEHTIKLFFTEEEERQFKELCTLYQEYQQHVNGWDAGEHVENDVLHLWVNQGLACHLLENYGFLKSVMLENLKKEDAA